MWPAQHSPAWRHWCSEGAPFIRRDGSHPWHTGSLPQDHFGERVAAAYDATVDAWSLPAVVEPTVALLAELAGGGPALELGIGTGRIALPLSHRGVRVHGIDLSGAMVAQLRAKPGAEHIETTIGDFADTKVDGAFNLAYLVFNTIMNLTSQEEQVRCFQNAADHLVAGGHFVVEVMVPALRRLPPGQNLLAVEVGPEHFLLDEYGVARQSLVSHRYWVAEDRLETLAMPCRYVWPAELDLMARLAGLSLRGRWAGWRGEPFTDESPSHVSVWDKVA